MFENFGSMSLLWLDKFGKMKRYNISFRRHSEKTEEIPKKNHKTKWASKEKGNTMRRSKG
jgi:hypothetical protein